MSLGGPVLRQHVVEFVRLTGVITDGVVDNTSTSGPWNWTVPDGVAELTLDGCGAGGGGGGGFNSTTQRAGAGGGGSGASVFSRRLPVIPGTQLTITLGAGGGGGAAGSDGTDGGNTSIANLTRGPMTGFNAPSGSWASGTLYIPRGMRANAATGSASSGGGNWGAPTFSSGVNSGATATITNSASPAAGAAGTPGHTAFATETAFSPYPYIGCQGSAGGGANTTGSTAGSNGGGFNSRSFFGYSGSSKSSAGTGGTDTTNSFGGGGVGGPSLWSVGGNGGGNATGTNQNGGDAPGYGGGGGGGGGSGAGGAGSAGYVRFTYWAAD